LPGRSIKGLANSKNIAVWYRQVITHNRSHFKHPIERVVVQFERKEGINRMDRIDRIKAMLNAEG
jgi:hypothetical protein